MRNWLIGIGVAVGAAALGIAAAYGGSELLKTYRPQLAESVRAIRGSEAWDAMHPMLGPEEATSDGQGPRGIRDRLKERIDTVRGRRQGGTGGQGERLSLEEAVEAVEARTADLGSGFKVAEVMEFERNFYAVIVEEDTGRGAMEVLIDPYTGRVTPEPGPNMMWNTKYGGLMHRSPDPGENDLSIEDARQAAQEYLAREIPGAVVNEGGYDFYGYYTFDYSVDGRTAGMLSIHGSTGEVWVHTWHGEFVAEKEMEE
jgi:hypothetical protein